MPDRSPLHGVYRRPYHRDPLVYVAVLVGIGLLVRAVVRETSLGWELFQAAMALPVAFALVAVVGGFFRDPPS